MQVILLQDLYKHGVAGEVVKVAPGFARNYLIPRKMAVQATESELRRTEAIRQNVEARRAQYDNMLNELAQQIDGVELIFGRRAASTGKLFGSVTTLEIAEALDEKTGVDLNRRRISQQSLREVGTHEVSVRLGNEISPTLIITIVPEEELAEFLAARERGEEIDPEDLVENMPAEGVEVKVLLDEEGNIEGVVTDSGEVDTEIMPSEVVQDVLGQEAEEETDE